MLVYILTNNINGKQYIGQTIYSLSKRLKEHIKKSRKPTTPITRALNKYGKYNFSSVVLKNCYSKDELNYFEKYFTDRFNTWTPNGYNLLSGNGVGAASKELKEKISTSHKLHDIRPSAFAHKRADEVNSKYYSFVDPFGNIVNITNLAQFCRINNLSAAHMGAVFLGKRSHHKGWRAADQKNINKSFILEKREISIEQRIAAANHNAKDYLLISPDNKIIKITNLKQFCKINKLPYNRLGEVTCNKRNTYKGWRREK